MYLTHLSIITLVLVIPGASQNKSGHTCPIPDHFYIYSLHAEIQGVFFNWYPPKNHKYGKKLKYQNWYPPKIHKYGKKLKYQNWYPPQIHKVSVDPAPDHAESRLPAQLLSLKPNMVVTSWHLEILGGTSTKVGNILLTKNT